MPKIKKGRVSIRIDMTPFVDIAFLLLTFFMLTTQFKPPEEVVIELPSSHSEYKLPESDVMLITITKDDRIFLGLDAQTTKLRVLGDVVKQNWEYYSPEVRKQYGTPENMAKLAPSVQVTLKDLPDLLIKARITNPKLRTIIKGDQEANYGLTEDIMDILEKTQITRFNLITNLERN
ncbi:MAG: Biopolymer transport protein ExbD/TolR [Ignavibacteriae bacterium]|nr:MAG: Biopolymer transport protein ExbD/TolR [Ignavibacteriota bacterium]